jgi:hypothetical protein
MMDLRIALPFARAGRDFSRAARDDLPATPQEASSSKAPFTRDAKAGQMAKIDGGTVGRIEAIATN